MDWENQYYKHVISPQTYILIQWNSKQNSRKILCLMKIKPILKICMYMQKAKKNQDNFEEEQTQK